MGFIDGRGRPELVVNPALFGSSRAHYRPADTAPPKPVVEREPTPRDVAKARTIDYQAAQKALAVAPTPRARAAAERALADAAAARDAAVQAWLGPKQRKDHRRKTGDTTP